MVEDQLPWKNLGEETGKKADSLARFLTMEILGMESAN